MVRQKEVFLDVKVPFKLKEKVFGFCDRRGVKIESFVVKALKDKLSEIMEDNFDNALVNERLKSPKFVTKENLKRYIQKQKKALNV